MRWRSIINFHFTRTNVHEITQLEKLLEPLYDLGDIYADSGYLSVNNCYAIVAKGGIPYIRRYSFEKRLRRSTFETKPKNTFTNLIINNK